ncbi:MAG: hypothetical protein J5736_03700, partial [Bacilli bacterium]|nr:hypothetical protein [Bacilli bacterium]
MHKKEKNPFKPIVGGITFLFLAVGVLFVAILGDFIVPGTTVIVNGNATYPEIGYKTALFSWSAYWRGLSSSKISIVQMIMMIIAAAFLLVACIIAIARRNKVFVLDGFFGFLEIGWASYLLGFFTGITGGLKGLLFLGFLGIIPSIIFIAIAFFYFTFPALFMKLKKEPKEEEEEEPEEEPKEEEKAEEPVEEEPAEEPKEEEKAEEPVEEEQPEEEKAEEPVEEEPKEEEPAEEP